MLLVPGDNGRGARRDARALGLLAGVIALCAVLLALSTNVASSLVPDEWAKRHLAIVVAATGVLALVSVWLAVAWWRRTSGAPEAPARAATGTGSAVGSVVASGARATVDASSITVRDTSGPVVIAETVTFQSLTAQPAPEQGEGQIVVGELPGAPPAFVSREAVERLTAALATEGSRVATVSALVDARGVGKTQVAAEYARRAVAEGVGLVAWVSADDHDRLVSGLAEVARRLGVADPEGDSEVSARRLCESLRARTEPAVLVLDNATDPLDVRRYLPSTGAVRVVITSNDRAFAGLGTQVDIGVFDRPQSVAYLARRTVLPADSGADAVADELGDLPLALAQAATVMTLKGLSYGAYLDRLAAAPLGDMLPADRGDPYPHGVASAISLSVDAVQEADASGLKQRALDACSLLATEGISRDVLAAVAGVDEGAGASLDDALAGLVEQSLLVWAKGRDAVVMHRLVARTIRDRLERAGALDVELGAVADALTHIAVPERQAWDHREAGLELVGHATALWTIALPAADRGAFPPDGVETQARLAAWAVRHLIATADLSRAAELGASVLRETERRGRRSPAP